MAIFLYALFVKGPRWVRMLLLLMLACLFLFAALTAATKFQDATERTAPNHAHSTRTR